MERLKTYLKIKPSEIPIYRIWTLIVAFFLPTYGLCLLWFDPNAIDFLSHRLVISFVWIFLLILSFISNTFKTYLTVPVFIANLVTFGWNIWVVYLNDFSFSYVMGLIVSMVCIGLFLRDKYELFLYEIVIAGSALLTYFSDNVLVNVPVYILSIAIIFVVFTMEMIRRDYANKEMNNLNRRLSHRNEELEQFAFIVSHDLKTPLRTIGSFAALLKNKVKDADSEIVEFADFIVNGALDMNAVMDDLLEFSRFTDLELETSEINLIDLISDVSRLATLANPEAEININIDKNLPQTIIGNEGQLKRLFQNLIDNGLKYNRSSNKKVDVKYQSDNKNHIFSILDNGIGLPLKYQHKAFLLFQRLHVDQGFKGTGVGLAICKRIVENHKGKIKVLSGSIEGTEFQFSLSRRL